MRLSVLEKQNSICKSQKQSVAGVLSGGVNVWEFGRETERTGMALCADFRNLNYILRA